MANNRTSLPSFNKSKLSSNPFILFGFATVGLVTDAPSNANRLPDTKIDTSYTPTVFIKKDEDYDGCLNANDFIINTYSSAISTLNSHLETTLSGNELRSAIDNAGDVSYAQFLTKFDIQASKTPTFITIGLDRARAAFEKSARALAKIPFEASSVDLLPSDGFKIILKMSDSKILIASQYMVDSDIPAENVVYSIYQNRTLVESNILSVSKLAEQLSA
ncbi:hypothetical protein ACFSR6_19310 [Pedobacter vanadiisoli]|uniref:Uncharacterized protein n=1 Tax=Pedobacter vanadiisoli TaxID=1761975 RepID=A0ABW5MP34_9SPHI